MSRTDWAYAVGLLLFGTLLGLTFVSMLPFLIFGWPIFLLVGIFHLIGEVALRGLWRLVSWPFRRTKSDAYEISKPIEDPQPVRPLPVRLSFWVGIFIGGLIAWIQTREFTMEMLGWT